MPSRKRDASGDQPRFERALVVASIAFAVRPENIRDADRGSPVEVHARRLAMYLFRGDNQIPVRVICDKFDRTEKLVYLSLNHAAALAKVPPGYADEISILQQAVDENNDQVMRGMWACMLPAIGIDEDDTPPARNLEEEHADE